MTFFHFLNCVTLTVAPYALTYMHSGLSEYSTYWKCAQAGCIYFLTQLVKLLILATIFPTPEHEGEFFDAFAEFMKSTVDIVDLLGLYFIISRNWSGKGEVRFLAAGLGWAAADAIATRMVPFWVGARGVGFDWMYIQMGIESNINLLYYLALATLLLIWSKRDLSRTLGQVVCGLFIFSIYRNFINELFVHQLLITSWSLLAVQFLLTFVVCIITLFIYENQALLAAGR